MRKGTIFENIRKKNKRSLIKRKGSLCLSNFRVMCLVFSVMDVIFKIYHVNLSGIKSVNV